MKCTYMIRQDRKGIPEMEGRSRWGRKVEERTPGRCKDGILQGMQNFVAPGATMDKTNRDKMFPQGKAAVRKG